MCLKAAIGIISTIPFRGFAYDSIKIILNIATLCCWVPSAPCGNRQALSDFTSTLFKMCEGLAGQQANSQTGGCIPVAPCVHRAAQRSVRRLI